MIFNDHSILLYRDYYWVILDCNHDYRLEHFPTLKFYFKNFEFNFHQWSNGIQWSFNTTAQGLLLPLNRHSQIHTGDKPFQCDMCGKKFTLKGGLTQHIRTHTTNHAFACTLCEYTCSLNHNLTVHMRTHTGEKPFTCDVCDQSFTSSSNLKQHQYKHSGEKPYSCLDCEKQFAHSTHSKGTVRVI